MTVFLGKGQAVRIGMVFPGSSLCLPSVFSKPALELDEVGLCTQAFHFGPRFYLCTS